MPLLVLAAKPLVMIIFLIMAEIQILDKFGSGDMEYIKGGCRWNRIVSRRYKGPIAGKDRAPAASVLSNRQDTMTV